MRRNNSSDRPELANRHDKLFTAVSTGILNSLFPTLLVGITGFFLLWVFFLLSRALFSLQNLPVALNHIYKQNRLCKISFLPDPFPFSAFILSSALRIETAGSSVFSGSAHKTSLPYSHINTRAKTTRTKNSGRIKTLPAPTKPTQAILYTNSKCSPSSTATITIYPLYKQPGL